MMTLKRDESGLTTIAVTGRLEHADYERVVPELEEQLKAGTRRVLLELNEFKGFTPTALVDELKFDLRHRKDFERIAVIGDSGFEDLGVRLIRPFFSGEVKIFDRSQRAAAEAWIREN